MHLSLGTPRLLVVVAGLVAVLVQPAAADPGLPVAAANDWNYAVAAGVMAHDPDLGWAKRNVEGGTDYNIEVLLNRPLFGMPFGSVRPNIGVSINDQGDTSRLYAGILWQLRPAPKLLFNAGVGLALHDGETSSDNREDKQFGSRVVFRLPFELGYEFNSRNQLLLTLVHMSNGYLASPNHGMDALGIRYRFLFR